MVVSSSRQVVEVVVKGGIIERSMRFSACAYGKNAANGAAGNYAGRVMNTGGECECVGALASENSKQLKSRLGILCAYKLKKKKNPPMRSSRTCSVIP